MSSLQQQCRTAVVADPSIAVALNTTYDQLVPYLLNLTCQNGCNGQGTCEQGELIEDIPERSVILSDTFLDIAGNYIYLIL